MRIQYLNIQFLYFTGKFNKHYVHYSGDQKEYY
jgi:hypothetical protein